jgi:hypothetical protein
MATQYAFGKIVTNGLVLALDAADRNSYVSGSTTWRDLSGNNNNGILTVSGSNAVSASYSSTNGGNILFSGTGSFISGSDVPFRFGNTFSISIWFYWDGLDKTNMSLFGKRNGPSGDYNQYSFSFNNGNPYSGGTGKTIVFFARVDGSALSDTALTYTFPSEGIYNISSVVNTTSQALYANGEAVTTPSGSSSINYTGKTFNISGRDLLIGTTRDNAGTGINTPFNNKIYNISIYDRALSATEILQNYNAQKSRFGLT